MMTGTPLQHVMLPMEAMEKFVDAICETVDPFGRNIRVYESLSFPPSIAQMIWGPGHILGPGAFVVGGIAFWLEDPKLHRALRAFAAYQRENDDRSMGL